MTLKNPVVENCVRIEPHVFYSIMTVGGDVIDIIQNANYGKNLRKIFIGKNVFDTILPDFQGTFQTALQQGGTAITLSKLQNKYAQHQISIQFAAGDLRVLRNELICRFDDNLVIDPTSVAPNCCVGFGDDQLRHINLIFGSNYQSLAPATDYQGVKLSDIVPTNDTVNATRALENKKITFLRNNKHTFNSASHRRNVWYFPHSDHAYGFINIQTQRERKKEREREREREHKAYHFSC